MANNARAAMIGAGITRDASIYGLAAVISQGTVLLAVPVYSRILGPAGFGVIELLIVGLQLLALVAIGGFEFAAIRLFFADDDLDRRRRLLSTGLVAVIASGVVFAVAVMVFADVIDRTYLQGFETGEAVVVGAIALPLLVGARYAREALRAQRRPGAYLVNSTTAGVLQVAVAVVLIAWFDFGPDGVMVGYLVAAVITLLMSVAASRQYFGIGFARSDFNALWGFGIPLVWTGLAGWSLMFVDRLVLSAFVGVDEVGIYALASRLAMGLTLVNYAFTRAWTPAVLELAEQDRAAERRTRSRVLNPFLAGVGAIAVAISVLAEPISRLIAGDAFADAADLVPIIALGLVMFAAVPVVQTPMLIEQRTSVLAWGSIVAAVANLGANLALVPFFGTAAAAFSTLIAMTLQTLLYWRAANRIDPTHYPVGRTARVLAVTAAFCAMAWLTFPAGPGGIALRVIAVLMFPAALFATRAISYRATVEALSPVVGRLRSSMRVRRP